MQSILAVILYLSVFEKKSNLDRIFGRVTKYINVYKQLRGRHRMD